MTRAVKTRGRTRPLSGWLATYQDDSADGEVAKLICPSCDTRRIIRLDDGPQEFECPECAQRITA